MPTLTDIKLKKLKLIMLALFVIPFLLTSCSSIDAELTQDSVTTMDVTSKSSETMNTTGALTTSEVVHTSETSSTPDDVITPEPEEIDSLDIQDPYAYLSLSVGNAEELTFEYVTTHPETQTSFLHQFFRFDGISGEKFETMDHEGELISITELELPDGVYYIDESKQKVYRFTETADDLILYRLMAITATEPQEIRDTPEGKCYVYESPFDQDDTIDNRYELLMTPNGIKSLDIFLGDRHLDSITFTEFLSVKSDPGLLQIPEPYTLEVFDYGVKYMNMPPWW
ncbi:hypothetical protein [Fusibacter bizertensis]